MILSVLPTLWPGFIRINSITGSTIENEWKFSIGKLQAL